MSSNFCLKQVKLGTQVFYETWLKQEGNKYSHNLEKVKLETIGGCVCMITYSDTLKKNTQSKKTAQT